MRLRAESRAVSRLVASHAGAACAIAGALADASIRLAKRVAVLALNDRLVLPTMPMLRDHVERVVALCSKKEVRRIYATRIVASVEHALANGYGPVREFPRHAVSLYQSAGAAPDAAIAEATTCRAPDPAYTRIRASNLRPEPFCERLHSSLKIRPLGVAW